MTDRESSPAYAVLRASAWRVLRLVDYEVRRQGGSATIYCDHLELLSSRRVYRQALCEIDALGLAEITRFPKRYECSPSTRWLQVRTSRDAQLVSSAAREADAGRWTSQRKPSPAALVHV